MASLAEVERRRRELVARCARAVIDRLAGDEGARDDPAELQRAIEEELDREIAAYLLARNAAARAAESRLQALADRAPAAVFVMDADGRYVFVNEHFAELLGRTKQEVLGRTNHELLPPERAEYFDAVHRRVLEGDFVETIEEVRRFSPPRHYTTLKFPVEGGAGRPAIGCVSVDVTERTRAEEEARHAAELLELGDAFFELDRDWRIVRVNANQERLSRLPRWRTVGRRFQEVWPDLCDPPSRYLLEYRRAMEERIPREFEEYYAPLDLWTAVTAYPVSGGGIAVFFRDATARKRAERDRERSREFEGQLLGIVSHDLRTPLSAITLGAHAMLQRGGLDERQETTTRRIQASAERAARLIHDLLDFAQVRMGGRIELRCRRVDLAACARQAIDEARSAFPGRDVALVVEEDAAGDWDPDRLAQVVANLVTNALKYSPPGAPVTVRVGASGPDACLEVHNGGSVIEPGVRARLFEPLQRGIGEAVGGEPHARSVGLGLFIVRTIVEAHRGDVSLESSAAAGTTFRVRLPRAGACGDQPAPLRVGDAA